MSVRPTSGEALLLLIIVALVGAFAGMVWVVTHPAGDECQPATTRDPNGALIYRADPC